MEHSPPTGQSPQAARHLVLVVDDSRTVRDLTARLVGELGFDVITAADGNEAVDKALSAHPDLILMDVSMPVMDGFAACQRIKEQSAGRHIPIIFVTSLEDQRQRLNALEAGGDDYVIKPPQREDLLFRLKTHLKVRQLTDDLRHVNENLERLVEEKSTAVIETERQLHQAEKMSALGTMLSGIVHELRNPLAVISGWTQILRQQEGMPSEATHTLKAIEEQAFRASAIVDNLLRLAHGKAASVSDLNLNDVVSSLVETLRFVLGRKDVTLQTDLACTRLVHGNASDFEEILINLTSNAVDAIEGKGCIRIATADEGAWCVLTVSDTGCGIPPEVQKRMFDPFFTTKEAGKGTGLGMSIVYTIVQSHQGRIAVSSKPGRGTTIAVSFPALQ